MSSAMLAGIAVGVAAVVGLLLGACSQNAISKKERQDRKFRKWLKEQTPEGEEPPRVP